jgi:glutamyl-tRNA synthetase
MSIVTRFAPSPTGMLHIGGARTALFNYLFARHHGGQFRLRIEDTDTARSTEAATKAILDGLAWLGLPHDGEVVYQSRNLQRHKEIVAELLAAGHAYPCYCSPEELSQMRADAEAEGRVFRYDRRWRDGGKPPEGIAPSIRIKAPLDQDVQFVDAVQGPITIPAGELDDFVIARADGTPTYMLAVVVDDHDMGVTHVIRGDDHLNNAARQAVVYQAMGWDLPIFAHIPLIHGPDGAKLSKRHGATSVTEYAALGYLPEAMRNYLARLGWSHGDEEIFSDAQAIAWFGLEAVGKSPARLDFDKLAHVNAHYMRQTPATELAQHVAPMLENAPEALLEAAITACVERASTLPELAEAVRFFVAPQPPDEKASAALAKGQDALALLIPALEALEEPWSFDTVKSAFAATAETHGLKMGALMPPARAAIVGKMAGPDIPEAMRILGKPETLRRLKAAVA